MRFTGAWTKLGRYGPARIPSYSLAKIKWYSTCLSLQCMRIRQSKEVMYRECASLVSFTLTDAVELFCIALGPIALNPKSKGLTLTIVVLGFPSCLSTRLGWRTRTGLSMCILDRRHSLSLSLSFLLKIALLWQGNGEGNEKSTQCWRRYNVECLLNEVCPGSFLSLF